jgi:hypothetical protein
MKDEREAMTMGDRNNGVAIGTVAAAFAAAPLAAMTMAVAATVGSASPLWGQVLAPVAEELDRLEWLVGEWEGTGWMEYTPGQRAEFRGTERVERRMGGRLVVVEGRFTAWMGPEAGEVPVHEAVGIFEFDPRAGQFRFRTYTGFGPEAGGLHAAEVSDGRVVWGYEDPRHGTVRYTITRTDGDEWVEVGDASRDGGGTWHRFFEMRLRRR